MAVDLRWEQREGHHVAVLTAAAPLAAGTVLSSEPLQQGRPWESQLAELGPALFSSPDSLEGFYFLNNLPGFLTCCVLPWSGGALQLLHRKTLCINARSM